MGNRTRAYHPHYFHRSSGYVDLLDSYKGLNCSCQQLIVLHGTLGTFIVVSGNVISFDPSGKCFSTCRIACMLHLAPVHVASCMYGEVLLRMLCA